MEHASTFTGKSGLDPPPGAPLFIQGSSFGSSGTVFLDNIPVEGVYNWSPTEIRVTLPSAPSYPYNGRLIVKSSGQQATGPIFTVTQPVPGRDNLLVNSSFELPDTGGSTRGYETGIPGWRITQGAIKVVAPDWPAAEGRQSIDLVGSPGVGAIEQTFYTQPGQSYLFTGFVSHNPLVADGRADVFVNGTFLTRLSHDGPAPGDGSRWQSFAYRFQATAGQTTLRIVDVTGLSDVAGSNLDGLRVTLAPN